MIHAARIGGVNRGRGTEAAAAAGGEICRGIRRCPRAPGGVTLIFDRLHSMASWTCGSELPLFLGTFEGLYSVKST